jgi:hypothetical protein
MNILIATACALTLGLGSAAHAQMASEKPKTEAMGAMSSNHMASDHMKAEKPMAKTPMKKMAKKPMAKKAETGAMGSAMSTDAMAKH